MGNVIMKAQQITYGASNVEKALDDLKAPELIELNKRMAAIDEWKANVHEVTYTGSVLTIENALALPARSLITEINAIQPLHGYDHPWAGGAYKNKIPPYRTAGNYTFEGATITVNDDNTVIVNGTSTNASFSGFKLSELTLPAGSYKINGQNNVDSTNKKLTLQLYNEDALDQIINLDSNIDYQFTLEQTTNLSVRVGFRVGMSVSNAKMYPMIRLATESDASFVPYSNICPISGRTAAVITRSDGDEISEDFTIQLGTTVYGADINWDTGVATVTHAVKAMDAEDMTYNYSSGTQRISTTSLQSVIKAVANTDVANIKCSCFIKDSANGTATHNIDGSIAVDSTGVVYIYSSLHTDASTFKTAMSGQTICYELATPTTIQLTPAQLELLKGYNRVTIDNGSIELKALVLGGDN